MSKYQITLTPIDRFFFGGDMTFSVKGQDEDFKNQYVSYIIQSAMFPQQTSLLGMLRFLLLRNAGEEVFKDGHIVNKAKAKELIGGRSFMVNSDNDFKCIKSISHVKIRRRTNGKVQDLEFAPLFKELNFNNASVGSYNLQELSIPSLSKNEYNAKKGIDIMLTDGKNKYALDDVFVKDRRIGINRDVKTGKVDDDALYKQISYRFNKRGATYCFVFEAEIDDCIPFESFHGQVVSVGGDNSQFVLGISKTVINNDSISSIDKAVWLLSPTYLSRKEAMTSKFAITRLMSFRFLTSEMDKVNSYNVLSRQLQRSGRYELYAPGSVFYFEDEESKKEFLKLLEGKKEFRQIGYNEYK